MKQWERAYLYVRRKKRKSLLLLLTIFLLSSFGVTGLLLRSMTDLAVAQTRQSLRGAFRIALDMQNRENIRVSEADGQTSIHYIGEPLNEKVTAAIQGSLNIDTYNAVIKENVLLRGELTLIDFNGNYHDDPVAKQLISVEGDTDSTRAKDFQKERLRLIAGEAIVASDRYAAVIGKELALQNHLRIGDQIQIAPCEGHAGREVSVTIKGLFEVAVNQQNMDVAAPVHLLENRIFMDITSVRILTDATGADYIDYFVNDPAQVPTIIEEIQKIQDINWRNFVITEDIDEYKKIAYPLGNISVLMDTVLAVIVWMSIVILSLIQSLFHKDRVYETGIMLSIGLTKAEIVLQRLIEIIMIALPSFLLSSALCFFIWNGISNIVDNMTTFTSNISFDMLLFLQTILATFACGITVLFLSVLLSNLWLMRLQPKKIFSKLS